MNQCSRLPAPRRPNHSPINRGQIKEKSFRLPCKPLLCCLKPCFSLGIHLWRQTPLLTSHYRLLPNLKHKISYINRYWKIWWFCVLYMWEAVPSYCKSILLLAEKIVFHSFNVLVKRQCAICQTPSELPRNAWSATNQWKLMHFLREVNLKAFTRSQNYALSCPPHFYLWLNHNFWCNSFEVIHFIWDIGLGSVHREV